MLLAATSGSSPGLVHDLAIVLGVAAVTGLASRLLRQPSILGYLFAGLIVGPYIPVPLFANPERVHALSELGVVLVMFAIGLEFRVRKFVQLLPVSGVTAVIEIGALFAAGYFAGEALGWNETQSLFLGACLCISSTMAVRGIFQQRPVPDDDRSFVFGILVLQDVAAIALIAIMTAVSQGAQASFGDALGILGKLLAVFAGMVVVGMLFVPRLIRLLERTKSSETLAVGAIGTCFAFALLASRLGYSAALGAFIGGVLVAESGRGHEVERATASVRDVFAAVFFVSVGMSVDPMVAWENLPVALLLVAVVVGTQLLSVFLGGVLTGSGVRRSVTAGLSLGQIGEFGFIIAGIGVATGVVRPELRPVLVTVAVLTTFTTALALLFRDQLLVAVDHLIPGSVRRVLVLYETWFDEMRARPADAALGVRRVLGTLLLDVLIMGAVVLSWRAWQQEIGATLTRTLGLGKGSASAVATTALVVALVPLLVTLALAARHFSRTLSDRVFSRESSRGRGMVRASIVLLIVASCGVPLALLLGPLVGDAFIWPALVIALLVALGVVVARARALGVAIESGGLLMLRAIAEQGSPSHDHSSTPEIAGLENLHEVLLCDGHFAVGQSLAEMQLRSLTGASVVAVRHQDGALLLPQGTEHLLAGQILVIAGCQADQEAAEQLLVVGALRDSIAEP